MPPGNIYAPPGCSSIALGIAWPPCRKVALGCAARLLALEVVALAYILALPGLGLPRGARVLRWHGCCVILYAADSRAANVGDHLVGDIPA